METPILFIIFNRPETTRLVFDEIRKAKPIKFFIAADGPRIDKLEDIEKCKATREIVSNIDWPCEVKTLFQEKNLGCKIAVSSAIDWFFEYIEEGIILEDDCLPDQSFFHFCEELLEKYKNEEKVMMIGGFNMNTKIDIKYSYIYSRFIHIWGWATWKRAWTKYDVEMRSWEEKTNQEKIKKIIDNNNQWKTKKWSYDKTFSGKKDTWDYQWDYACLLNHGLCIIPSKNLVKNIGFNDDATHTKKSNACMETPSMEISFPLQHNHILKASSKYDSSLFKTKTLTERIIDKIKEKYKKYFLT